MATQQLILPRALDANGNPASGAKALVYQTGTTTPVTVFTDTALTTPHANPIVANSAGYFAQAFYGGTTALKVVFTDAADAALYTLDPVPLVGVEAGAASGITAEPFTGVSGTNVQTQLQQVQANITANTANITTLVETAGSSNAYTLAAAQTLTAYATGQRLLVRINHQNTGAATINVDGLGARDVQKYNGAGALVALAAGDLQVGDIAELTYDGTRFVLLRSRISGQAGPTATTSGTAFDFTGIPPGVTEIDVIFEEVSLSGTDSFLVQIGDAGGIETTGYNSSGGRISPAAGGTPTVLSSTSGFIINAPTSADTFSGSMTLRLSNPAAFRWAASHAGSMGGSNVVFGGGGKALSEALTQVRVTRTGSNTFDAGSLFVRWRY